MQLDNFIDLFVFGSVPWMAYALLHHTLAFPLSWTFWSAAFFYFIAAASRLGFYTIRAEKGESTVFIGVPTTMVGMLWSLIWGTHPGLMTPREATLLLLFSAIAMIAPVKIPRPNTPVLIAMIVSTLVLMTHATMKILAHP